MKKIKDYYFNLAKNNDYLARSVFKLKEIDDKYKLIKNNIKILDLGASPGSWIQYCLTKPNTKIVAVDIKPLKKTFHKNVRFIQNSISEIEENLFSETNFDLILSDMAPNTTGNKGIDHQKSISLADEVIKITYKSLKRNGNLICKIFQGEDLNSFVKSKIKPAFSKYKLFKPKSSRSESTEIYIIGFNYIYSK